MKRVLRYLLPIFIILAVGISSARGEDYVSSDFPPEAVLMKAIADNLNKMYIGNGGKINSIKIIGKAKKSDNSYSVYYYEKIDFPVTKEQVNLFDLFELIKLDTDKWVFRYTIKMGTFGASTEETAMLILQKLF